jgi:hypothetical protein
LFFKNLKDGKVEHLKLNEEKGSKDMNNRIRLQILFQIWKFSFFSSEPASIYDLAMLALDQPEAGWNECDGEKSGF